MLLRSLKILVYWFGRCNVYPSNVSGPLLFPVHIKDNDMHITFTSVASLIYNVFHTHTHQNIRNSGCRQNNPPGFRNWIPRIPFPASSWERSLWQKAYPSPQKYGCRVQPHASIHPSTPQTLDCNINSNSMRRSDTETRHLHQLPRTIVPRSTQPPIISPVSCNLL
jgi:hypothetical protein